MADLAASGDLVLDSALKFGVLCIVAELATRAMLRAHPSTAHRLWMLVAGASVLLPLAAAATPPVFFLQPGAAVRPVLAASPASPAAVWFFFLWAAGLAVGVVRLVVGLRAIAALVRESARIPDADAAQLRASASFRMPRAARCAFVETATMQVPITVGWLRPCIVLPAGWRRWPRARLAAVLAHEGAHVDRADYAIGLMLGLLRAVWWWHPGVWLVSARVHLSAEIACDLRAAGSGRGAEYASHLLAVAKRASRPPVRFGWTIGAATRLRARVEALLDERARGATGTWWPQVLRAGVVIAAVAIALGLAPVRFAAVERRFDTLESGGAGHDVDHAALHAERHAGHPR